MPTFIPSTTILPRYLHGSSLSYEVIFFSQKVNRKIGSGGARNRLAVAVQSQHLNPDKAGSILHDLPVRPCRPMYTASEITSPTCFRETDKFLFQCFKLSRHHTTSINNIFLEEAHTTSSIIYHSQGSLKSSLEQYFKSETTGIKAVLDPRHIRHLHLIALEKIVRDLGSSVSCRMNAPCGVSSPPRMFMSSFVAYTVAYKLLAEKHTELPRAYSLMNQGESEIFCYKYICIDILSYRSERKSFLERYPPSRSHDDIED